MKTQDFIDVIKGNLGNRSSGRIGSFDVDVAVLQAVNIAMPHLVQEAQPDYYNRTATLAIVEGTRDYALPVVDTDLCTIRIKDIYGVRCSRAGGSSVLLKQINYSAFVKATCDFEEENTGTPSFFALWGKMNRLYLDTVPSEDLTMTMYIETFPVPLTSADLNTPLPLDDQWLNVAEAYATQYLYLKLQQVEMQREWYGIYALQKASVSRMEDKKQSKNIQVSGRVPSITDPVNNPAVRRWN